MLSFYLRSLHNTKARKVDVSCQQGKIIPTTRKLVSPDKWWDWATKARGFFVMLLHNLVLEPISASSSTIAGVWENVGRSTFGQISVSLFHLQPPSGEKTSSLGVVVLFTPRLWRGFKRCGAKPAGASLYRYYHPGEVYASQHRRYWRREPEALRLSAVVSNSSLSGLPLHTFRSQ